MYQKCAKSGAYTAADVACSYIGEKKNKQNRQNNSYIGEKKNEQKQTKIKQTNTHRKNATERPLSTRNPSTPITSTSRSRFDQKGFNMSGGERGLGEGDSSSICYLNQLRHKGSLIVHTASALILLLLLLNTPSFRELSHSKLEFSHSENFPILAWNFPISKTFRFQEFSLPKNFFPFQKHFSHSKNIPIPIIFPGGVRVLASGLKNQVDSNHFAQRL